MYTVRQQRNNVLKSTCSQAYQGNHHRTQRQLHLGGELTIKRTLVFKTHLPPVELTLLPPLGVNSDCSRLLVSSPWGYFTSIWTLELIYFHKIPYSPYSPYSPYIQIISKPFMLRLKHSLVLSVHDGDLQHYACVLKLGNYTCVLYFEHYAYVLNLGNYTCVFYFWYYACVLSCSEWEYNNKPTIIILIFDIYVWQLDCF